ncbi:hypothetical protein B0H11DRAFT_2124552 [Mycena galericulata]|nr:hypothetical protein B0H11DRAFT_2124552 [Mycena galericulata]
MCMGSSCTLLGHAKGTTITPTRRPNASVSCTMRPSPQKHSRRLPSRRLPRVRVGVDPRCAGGVERRRVAWLVAQHAGALRARVYRLVAAHLPAPLALRPRAPLMHALRPDDNDGAVARMLPLSIVILSRPSAVCRPLPLPYTKRGALPAHETPRYAHHIPSLLPHLPRLVSPPSAAYPPTPAGGIRTMHAQGLDVGDIQDIVDDQE